MNEYEKLRKALDIFAKYEHRPWLSAEHDELFAGPDPSVVSAEDIEALDQLGWSVSSEPDMFRLFV